MKRTIRKTKEKILSLILIVAVLLTMQSIMVLAKTEMTESEMEDDQGSVESTGIMPFNPVHHCTKTTNWADGTDYTVWSYIYFGSYPQTEITGSNLTSAITEASYDVNGDAWVNGIKYRRISKRDTNNEEFFGNSEYRYFKWERIKWRVLKNEGSTLFVVADKGIDCKSYNEKLIDITWENCTLRNWLNNDFYSTAFNAREQGAIEQQNVVNEDNPNPNYHTEGGNDTTDKVYLLSIGEAADTKYGFCEDRNVMSKSRCMQISDYAHVMGGDTDSWWNSCYWWLRSPGWYTNYATFAGGCIDAPSVSVDTNINAVVPVLHLKITADCWTSVDNRINEEEENTGTTGDGGSLTLGENKTGTAGSNVSDFFPATWSLKSTVFPVEISKSGKPDGTYTIKGAVGIGKSDWLDDNAKWNKFKSNVNDAQKYTGRVNCLESYRKTWNVKSLTVVSTDKFKTLPKLSVMGYFENTYDKNGNLISQTGKLAADANWSGSINWQFVTPIGPIYLNLEGSGKLSGKLGPKYDYSKRKLKIADGNLMFSPTIALEGGYGINKVATIGAKGELSVPITIIPATKGEFQAKASLHVKLVFVIDYTHDLASYKTTLWGEKAGADATGIELAEGTLSEMDTSFVSYAGKWNGSALPDSIVDNTGISENMEVMMQDGLLPSSLPMQADINGKTVMVFQSYDAERDTLNSSKLMYSVCDNGIWSDPQPVWDNGCSDLYVDMKVVGGKLVLVWQKEKAEITGDLESDQEKVVKEIAENSEISFAEFDSESGMFIHQTYVTDNASYDMMPKICSQNDNIVISWIRNDAGNLMQESGVSTIYTASWNGESFDTENMLVESDGTIDDFITYRDGTAIKTIYTGQVGEENICAFYDENNQLVDALADLTHPAAEGLISGMHYIGGKVNFLLNGMLYSYDTTEKIVVSYLAGNNTFGSTAQYCSNGEKQGYVWSMYDEQTDTGKIVVSMEEQSGYSNPVTLYEKKGVIWRYVSPIIDENGNWKILANAMHTETEGQKENHNSLFYINPEINSGIELAGASIDEDDVKDGLTGVDYFVENTGDTTIQKLQLKMILSNGRIIQKEIPVTILPGENIAETAYVDLSEVNQAQKASISIYEEGQLNIEDCTVTDTIGQTDVAVWGTAKESDGDVIVTAELSNKSSLEAKTTLYLYGDEKQTKELCLPQEKIVKANDNNIVNFKIKKEDITYNENHAAYLTLKAEVENGDYDESNNIGYVVFYKEESADKDKSENLPAKEPNSNSDVVNDMTSIASKDNTINVKSISLKAISKKIAAGKKVTLTAKVLPENATNRTVIWKTSNSKYATVNSKGVVSTKKAGKGKNVIITAIAADGSSVKASVKLKLMKNAVTKVQIKNPPKSLKIGKSIMLKTNVKTNGKNANKILNWTISNEKYATITSKGKITAKKVGKGKTVTIMAISTDGTNKKAKVKLKIK